MVLEENPKDKIVKESEHIVEKWTLVKISCIEKPTGVVIFLVKNVLLQDAIEGHITELKEVGSIRTLP